MRNKFWWYLLGGGIALWAINRAKADASVEGLLNVKITWKAKTNTPQAISYIMNVMDAMEGCGGPKILGAVGGTSTSGSAAVGSVNAVWTHSKMGPIKESTRVCTLAKLQGLDPNVVDFQATRVS
jgi:hypothetical protein